MFRKGEKSILNYLIDASIKCHGLVKMSVKDARKEVNRDGGKYFAGMADYATGTIIGGLIKESSV
jgi:hypothetical protein